MIICFQPFGLCIILQNWYWLFGLEVDVVEAFCSMLRNLIFDL